MKSIQKPFYFEVFDDFLNINGLKSIKEAYKRLEFKEIQSDLFKFTISEELCNHKQFDQLKYALDSLFKPKIGQLETFYTFSASYYRKNDFLLCHDDMIDERVYAFIYYLEDFDSGNLLIYENDCVTLHESIEVKSNRLVIFKVSDKSFHEVQKCTKTGRKAISGWINNRNVKNEHSGFLSHFSVHPNVIEFDLGLDFSADMFYSLELDMDETAGEQPLNTLNQRLVGPFIDRRVYEIEKTVIYVPKVQGYILIHTDCLLFKPDFYILTNDKINMKECDLFDVFVFECSESVSNFINYQLGGETIFEIDAVNKNMHAGKRQNCKIYMKNNSSDNTVLVYHYLYEKINQTK